MQTNNELLNKIAELEIALKEEKLLNQLSKEIINKNNTIIIGVDNKHRIQYFNEAAEKYTHHKKEDILGTDLFDLVNTHSYRKKIKTFWENSLLKDNDSIITPSFLKDSLKSFILWRSFKTENSNDNENPLIFFSGEPISGEEISTNFLKENENKFHAIFKNHNIIMLLIEPSSGKIVNANFAASNFYGKSIEELKQSSIYDLNINKPEEIRAEIETIIKMGTYKSEIQQYNYNGEVVVFEIYSSIVNIENTKLIYSLLIDVTKQKQTEKELVKLSWAIQNSPASIFITDVNGIIEYVNTKFTSLTGYSHDEAIGKTPALLKSGLQSSEFYEEMWQRLNDGFEWEGEFYNIKKNGESYWEHAKISPIKDENGNITNFVAVKEDITRKKLNEKIIRKNRFILNETQRIAKIGGWEYRVSDRRVIWTDEVFNILSIERNDTLSPKEIIKYFHPEEVSKVYGAFADCLKNGKSFRLTARFTNAKSKKMWVEISGKAIYTNNIVSKVIGYISDISELKSTQEKLQKSEERYRITTNATGDVFYKLNFEDMKYEYLHSNIEKLTGYSSDEIDLRSIILKIESENKKIDISELENERFASSPIQNRYDYLIKTKDGKEKWIEDISFPITDSQNSIVGSHGVLRDITIRKKMESAIEARKLAEKADKMKSIFLAQMSHEIRTPINALVSMASLLRYDFEETITEEQRASFDIMDRAGERIIRTIDLILNLSEIQAGTYQISKTEFDLYSDILSVIILQNKSMAKKKEIKLTLNGNTKNTKLHADFYTVNQIFIQLIENALVYTEKGEVTVNVFRDEENHLAVEVKDTGIGISSKYLPNLFEPFTQEEMGYTRKYEGNGIGMTLVKNYCDINNAIITVESEKGVGTLFTVTFKNK